MRNVLSRLNLRTQAMLALIARDSGMENAIEAAKHALGGGRLNIEQTAEPKDDPEVLAAAEAKRARKNAKRAKELV